MALVAREASGLDFLEALDGGGDVVIWRHRRRFGLHCRQVEGGAAITARDEGGRLVCIGGLYGLPHGEAEVWFAAGPAFKANALAAVRALRRYFTLIGQEAAPLTAIAYVRPEAEGVAGARLARWLGFEDDGLEQNGLGLMRRFIRRF